MKNKKGFTLIELLAVIVILAIIALIATPIILNMIENAKKGAAKDSAYGYIEAIEYNNSIADLGLNNNYTKIPDGEDLDVTTLGVKVKGSKPASGTITIKKGNVTKAELCINGYVVLYDGQEAEVDGKCREIEKEDEEIVLKGDPILDKAKSLVYDETGKCKLEGTYEYMGGCYIKGNSETNEATANNYVWYNGFLWRIMGINSDNTVKLITNEIVTAIPYGFEKDSESYSTNKDYINDWLNTYFLEKLNSTKDKTIAKGKYFCNEITTNSSRINDNCSNGKEVDVKVGIISLDEYNLAGEKKSYLTIGQYFWTMTPNSDSYVWYVDSIGYVSYDGVATASYGIRPIINVVDAAVITKGSGTSTDYYVLAEDKNSDKTGKINSVVTSGEYVNLEGKTYRVVSKNNDGVKLILEGFYDTNVNYGDNNTFTTTAGIGLKLNDETDSTSVISTLGLSNSTKIKETTWYQGTDLNSGYTYKNSLSEEVTGIKAKVGLIRIGELLSGYSSTLSTKKNYWTMNKNNTSSAWYVELRGISRANNAQYGTYAIRPVIVVRNDLDIISGNGTPSSPYEI